MGFGWEESATTHRSVVMQVYFFPVRIEISRGLFVILNLLANTTEKKKLRSRRTAWLFEQRSKVVLPSSLRANKAYPNQGKARPSVLDCLFKHRYEAESLFFFFSA